MAKTWKSRGYIFKSYTNDHRPYHIHIFTEKGKEIGRFDLENQVPYKNDNFTLTKTLRKALNDCGFLKESK